MTLLNCTLSQIRHHKGFTLIEVMVAISIFAIVSLLVMGGLNNVLNTREASEDHLDKMVKIQMAFAMISRELRQLSVRKIRAEYGAFSNAVLSESNGVSGLEFSHQGRFIPDNDKTRLQRVLYYWEDQKLMKKVWSVIDRVEDTQARKQVLLSDIDSVSFSFFSESSSEAGNFDGHWQGNWSGTDEKTTLTAIKVTITTSDFDELYRIFQVVM